MAGQKHQFCPIDATLHQQVRGGPEGGVDLEFFHIAEPLHGVQTTATKHTDQGGG